MSPLFASLHDGGPRTHLRIGVAAIAGLELLVETVQVFAQSQDPQHYAPKTALTATLASMPVLAWLCYAMILLGLVGVALDRRPVLGGVWALAWASLLSAWQTGLMGSPSRNAFFPGAVLLGWVLGQLWGMHAAPERASAGEHRALRERLGEAGALGCLAAAYVGSCLSKLLTAGFAWGDGLPVRALVLRQQPVADWSWLLAYRELVITDATLGRIAGTATLVIEGGAFLLLFGPRLRLAWAALLFGLHTNILLLCTMPYLEPMVLLLLLAVPWQRRGDEAASAPDTAVRIPRAIAATLAAIVVGAWLLAPWGWRDEHRDRGAPTGR